MDEKYGQRKQKHEQQITSFGKKLSECREEKKRLEEEAKRKEAIKFDKHENLELEDKNTDDINFFTCVLSFLLPLFGFSFLLFSYFIDHLHNNANYIP